MKLQTKTDRLKTLLQKYNVPGPRYTSYPTVPAWTESVGCSDFEHTLENLKDDDAHSLYFHLPFCENLCHFCGCTQVITKDRSRSKEYVDVLLLELNRVAKILPKKSRKVTQIHFGGGTPNFLQPQELTQIMEMVRLKFDVMPNAEIAIELHPRTSTAEFNKNLKELGFNRISMGIQDFDPEVQRLINRHQNFEMTKVMLNELRALGFDSFNFDLVYGLPGQTISGWQQTLKQVVELKPNRLAVYSYAHVPWIRPVQRTFLDSDLPTPEMKLALFEEAYATLLANRYLLIGMDHFARVGDELATALNDGSIHRNFMGYSTRADAHQIGFGMSAISYVGGNYFQNQKDLRVYLKEIRENKSATFKGMLLTPDDAIRRDLITQLMSRALVDIPAFESKWNLQFSDYFKDELKTLEGFVSDDLLEVSPNKIKVKDEGFLFLRNMAMGFDKYLDGIRKNAINPTFSKTV